MWVCQGGNLALTHSDLADFSVCRGMSRGQAAAANTAASGSQGEAREGTSRRREGRREAATGVARARPTRACTRAGAHQRPDRLSTRFARWLTTAIWRAVDYHGELGETRIRRTWREAVGWPELSSTPTMVAAWSRLGRRGGYRMRGGEGSGRGVAQAHRQAEGERGETGEGAGPANSAGGGRRPWWVDDDEAEARRPPGLIPSAGP